MVYRHMHFVLGRPLTYMVNRALHRPGLKAMCVFLFAIWRAGSRTNVQQMRMQFILKEFW